MKTHHRLIVSIIAISMGIFLIGSGIFEPEELFTAFNIPQSAGKYMAFSGMGIAGFGIWQMIELLQNRERTWADLVSWAEQEYIQALLTGVVCAGIGTIIVCSLLWSFVGVMQTGSPIPIRPGVIGFGIGFGGILAWLGLRLIKVAIAGNSKGRNKN
jgi:hypothetical protein